MGDGNRNIPVARILALDLGKSRIGLAVSDELGITAQGLETLQRASMRADLAELAGIISEKGVSLILMGKPLHMKRTRGPAGGIHARFRGAAGQSHWVPVEFRDERLTTVQAERVLREGGVHLRADRAKSVDMLSAVLLLQDYLDSRRI